MSPTEQNMRETLDCVVASARYISYNKPTKLEAVLALRKAHPYLPLFMAGALIDAVRNQDRRAQQLYGLRKE